MVEKKGGYSQTEYIKPESTPDTKKEQEGIPRFTWTAASLSKAELASGYEVFSDILDYNHEEEPMVEETKGGDDRVLIDAQRGIFIVCDGMGGYQGGMKASQIVMDSVYNKICASFHDNDASKLNPEAVHEALRHIFSDVRADLQRARQQGSFRQSSMNTTVSVCFFVGKEMYVANLGDSPIYMHHEGELTELTQAHNIVFEAYDNPETQQIVWDVLKNVTRPEDIPDDIELPDQVFEIDDDTTKYNFADYEYKLNKPPEHRGSVLLNFFLRKKNYVPKSVGGSTDEKATPFIAGPITVPEGAKIFGASDGITDRIRDNDLAKLLEEDVSTDTFEKKLLAQVQETNTTSPDVHFPGWRDPAPLYVPDDCTYFQFQCK